MRIDEHVTLVGSGTNGFDLSHSYDSHIYLVQGSRRCVLIDAGAGVNIEPVLRRVFQAGIDSDQVDKVILTHAHADHAGGARRLRDELHADVVCSSEVADIVRTGDEERAGLPVGKASGTYGPEYRMHPCPVDGELEDNEVINLGDCVLRVIRTPGHSVGHIAVLLERKRRADLFTGDALLFGGRIVLQNSWDCNLAEQIATLHKLAELEFNGFYPAHFSFSARDGRRHLMQALDRIERGGIPELLG